MKVSTMIAASVFLFVMECACSPGGTGDMSARKLINNKCSICHSTTRIFAEKRSRQEWDAIVDRMIRHGAKLDGAEEEAVKGYLLKEYAK